MTSYRDVCEAKTKKEMQKRFRSLLKEVAEKHGKKPSDHKNIQLSNVGYFAGYYDGKVSGRVNRWLGAYHPVFGSTISK